MGSNQGLTPNDDHCLFWHSEKQRGDRHVCTLTCGARDNHRCTDGFKKNIIFATLTVFATRDAAPEVMMLQSIIILIPAQTLP